MKPNINDIIQFFDDFDFKNQEVKLDQCTNITNVKNFVESHKKYLLANRGKKLFLPYYNRLLKLYLKLKQ